MAGNLSGSSGFTPDHARETLLIGRDITPLVDLRWRVTIALVASAAAMVTIDCV